MVATFALRIFVDCAALKAIACVAGKAVTCSAERVVVCCAGKIDACAARRLLKDSPVPPLKGISRAPALVCTRVNIFYMINASDRRSSPRTSSHASLDIKYNFLALLEFLRENPTRKSGANVLIAARAYIQGDLIRFIYYIL